MYFARQANDINAKIFEISEKDFLRKTPFYRKISISLSITGDKDLVEENNRIEIFKRHLIMPGLSDVVAPLQYYKPNKNTKESVQDRLTTYQKVSAGTSTTTTSGGSSGGY